MIEIDIPGRGRLLIENAVFDVNGTLAEDGVINEAVLSRLKELAALVNVYLLTADTYGTIRSQLEALPVEPVIVNPPGEREQKADFVFRLGLDRVAVFGNGANDFAMFEGAALGVAVLGPEGCFTGLLTAAHIVVPSPVSALELLLKPKRLIAALRY
ncbi:MAG: ATPase P [Actinobacteria bacterium]|nr:ATPase P [Actinomycetota bacterium]